MIKPAHVMLRVLEEQRSVQFYEKALGLKVADRFEFETFALLYLSSPESTFELELTINRGRKEPYVMGDAFGHLAFLVDDLSKEHARMTASKINPEPIKKLMRGGEMLASFFFVTDPDGYRIEIIQRFGRYVW